MTRHRYIAGAPEVAQVTTGVPANIVAGADIFLEFTAAPGRNIHFLTTTASTAAAVTGLVDAWNASTDPVFAEVTASASTDGLSIVLTADTAGTSFGTLASSVTGNSAAKISEIDTITLPTSPTVPTGGTWTLTFDGETTSALNHNANAAQIQAALLALTNIAAADVTVGGTGPFSVYFQGLLANQNLSALSATSHLLGVGTIAPSTVRHGIGGTSEVQTFTVDTGASGGTLSIVFRGVTSTNIAYDANTAVVQSALDTMSTIGTGNVVATTSGTQGEFIITFQNGLANLDLPQIAVNSAVTGDVDATVSTTTQGYLQNEVQTLTFSAASAGDYTLSFNDGATTATTSALQWCSAAGDVLLALEALENIAAGEPLVSGSYTTGSYTIEFANTKSGLPQELIVADDSHLNSKTTVTLTPDTTTEGQAFVADGAHGIFTLSKADATEGTSVTLRNTVTNQTAQIGWGNTTTDVDGAIEAMVGCAVTGNGAAFNTADMVWETDVNKALETLEVYQNNTNGTPTVTINAAGDDDTPAVNEIQTLVWNTTPNTGTFTLNFNGQVTAGCNHNVDAAGIQTALEGLSNIDPGDVAVTGSAGAWTITYGGNLAATDVAELTVPTCTLAYEIEGGGTITVARTYTGGRANEVQEFHALGTPDAGTFQLTFDSEVTSATGIAWNATAATVRTELGGLSTVGGTENILVSGTSITDGFAVTFTGALEYANQNALVVTSALTGILTVATGTTTDGVNGQNQVQTVTRPAAVTGGTFRFLFTNNTLTGTTWSTGGTTTTSASLNWNATASEVEAALENLVTIGVGNVAATETATGWTITFVGDRSGYHYALLTADEALTGANLCTVSEITAGEAGEDERQAIYVRYATAGYWQVGVGSTYNTTSALAYNATAAEVQAALAVAPISKSTVVTKGTSASVTTYSIRFSGTDSNAAQPQIIGRPWPFGGAYATLTNKATGIPARTATGAPATNDQQRLVLTASGGTYQAVFKSVTSTGIAYAANAAQLQLALEAVSTIGTGNILVSNYTGSGFLITFQGSAEPAGRAGADQPDIGIITTGLTAPMVAVTPSITTHGVMGANAWHRLSFYSSAGWGYGYLSYGWESNGLVFPYRFPDFKGNALVHYGDTAAQVQTELEKDPAFTGNVLLAGGPVGTSDLWIQFVGSLGYREMPILLEGWPCWKFDGALNLILSDYGSLIDGVTRVNQVQTLAFSTTPTSGTWTITHNDTVPTYFTTSVLQWNSNAATIQTALEQLQSVGGGNVLVSGNYSTGGYTVTFQSGWAGYEAPLFSVTSNMPSVTAATAIVTEVTKGRAIANEVQTLTLSGNDLSGNFMLALTGCTADYTSEIAPPYTAADVQAALVDTTAYGANNVEVTGNDGGPLTITWKGAKAATAIDMLGFAPTTFKGASPTVTWDYAQHGRDGVDAVERIIISTLAAGGYWTITVDGATTGHIAHNATAAEVQAALTAITTVGSTGCTVGATSGGHLLYFGGQLGNKPLAAGFVTADGTTIVSSAYLLTVESTTPGYTAGNEQQLLTPTANLTAGTFTITFDGHTTTSLPYNASNAALQAALDVALGFGNSLVTLGPLPNTAPQVELKGTYAGTNCALVTVNSALTVSLPTIAVAISTAGSPGTTVAFTVTTANSGKGVWDNVYNWEPNTLPVAGDALDFVDLTTSITEGLPQDGTKFGVVTFWSSFTGNVGLPDVNASGTTSYPEYRDTTLKIAASEFRFGFGDGNGSPFMRIDLGLSDLVNIDGTGTSHSTASKALNLTGGTTSTILNVKSGSVGIAMLPGETAFLSAINIGNEGAVSNVNLALGEGLDVGTITANGGTIYAYCGYDTAVIWKGYVYQMHGAPGDVTLKAATKFYYCTPENGGDFVVDSKATLDFDRGTEAVSITTLSGVKTDTLGRCTVLG